MITRTDKISVGFAPSAADPQASGSQHYAEFDPKKPLQSKLVIPLGGVNSDPWKMGWAVDRGYHVLTVDLWNDYPKDPGYPEYLESWSGEDKSQTVNQNPANSVMARVKAGLKYMAENDPGSDWAYFLDAAGEVRWNDVIVFGYSFGGQMGVAASKYIAADRIIITSAPNVPMDSPWLKQESKTPPGRCYFLGGNKDGEHKTHMDETALLGWPGDVLNVTKLPPPYATNRLEVDDGHSSFCGRPFNDGMIDWDSICEFMFHTKK
jgi:pimeloyl-ACP methyl ester carboxylesterase